MLPARLFRGIVVLAVAAFVVGLGAGPALGWHWKKWGWRDQHRSYPGKPSGYQQIVNRFGEPCSARARANKMYWRAADTGDYYPVYFHRRLGGSRSSNLDNDVRGHIGNQHLDRYVKSGIWGYNCRYIGGTRKWSTHAWGIAVDVSSRREPNGQCYSRVNHNHAPIWKNHRWTWGKKWCDPMHFQYASNY